MDVHAYNLHPKETPEARRDHGWAPPGLGDPDGIFPSKWFSGGSKEDLHEFLGSGLDLLVIALPLTDKTKHLIGHAEFDVLSKKKTFVTNIGRGPIVVTDDLIDALENEKIRGAALDVTDPEPLPDGHRLWKVKNLIITPHVSGNSVNYLDRLLSILESNLERLSEGKDLINKVNRKDGY
jgi:phosphoglycerate dehydrogenase-like enzyme